MFPLPDVALMVLGMFGLHTGMAAVTYGELMEDEPVTLVANIAGSVLMAAFIGHCFCQPSTGCSNEKRPMVIIGKQWIKKTEFKIFPHPSHKKHPCSNERDPNENQSVSDLLPQISKKLKECSVRSRLLLLI